MKPITHEWITKAEEDWNVAQMMALREMGKPADVLREAKAGMFAV